MKMIFRGDDLGISEGVNYGLLKIYSGWSIELCRNNA